MSLDLLNKAELVPPLDDASVKEMMVFHPKTREGRAVYKKYKQTVEPVFGIIKIILGFRKGWAKHPSSGIWRPPNTILNGFQNFAL